MRNAILVLSIIILSALSAARPAVAGPEDGPLHDLLALATSLTAYDQRDTMLLNGAQRFAETSSFLAIAHAAAYDATKNRILTLGVERARSVNDVIALARSCPAYDVRDRNLLSGTRLAQQPADFLALSGAAAYDATKNTLMQQGAGFAQRAADLVALARTSPAYDVRDRILLGGASRVHGLDEYFALFGAAAYDATKVSILKIAVREATNVSDVARVATASPAYDARDQMLLGGVRLCTSAADAQFLASKAAYDATKNAILRQYAQMSGFGALYGAN